MTIAFLILTRYWLLLDDWRAYPISFFALVAAANVGGPDERPPRRIPFLLTDRSNP